MNLKNSFTEYTEDEFLELIKAIENAKTESERDHLLEHFITVTEHPAGSDLLYYPEPDADDSPKGILQTVKEWRAAHNLPGIKSI
ncbi:bacteriocin immunity protein [Pseudomonas chengduensis]|nr:MULTISPECIES: bacteriocin immunity protein [Pseudomonas]MDH0624236.1 bacteriocin immunity protein [Pseudomonas chengduensis]MDH1211602.1 bacteriocin immunity protein [Pseudomonas chengduensis]MDH1283730.1 bacteriocin immunity protein [Pseudomonas chengduensis]MDH1666728.1 bacteriocin immunity protein [Pseudomonas chengduensis]MDH1684859.1 bacteriocin immunity protein [Pseudomonas chengduensis]